jgi:hypothetical protein
MLGGTLGAQQPTPPPKPPEFPAPPPSSRIWKSQTTGKEYRVWIENDRLYAEWVNIPAAAASQGASIRIECRRMDGKWVGTAQNSLPCDTIENGKRITNSCRVTSKIEFDPLEASRISGRTEWARRFDCANCRVLEFAWHNFEWVPKEPTPVPMRK